MRAEVSRNERAQEGIPEEGPSPSISSRTIIFFPPLGPHSTGPMAVRGGQRGKW